MKLSFGILLILIFGQCYGDLNSMLSRVEDLNKSIQSLKEDHELLNEDVNLLEEQLRQKRLKQENTSAFDAYASPGSTFNLVADGTAIPFYETTLNAGVCNCTAQGQCYNPLFGFFQAPEHALYYFAVNIVSPADFINNVFLRVADSSGVHAEVSLKTYVAGSTELASGSHQVGIILELEAGSQMSVVSDSGSSGPGYVDVVPGTLTSFIGVQI